MFVSRKSIYDFLFMGIAMSALSVAIYDMFTNQLKSQKFDHRNEGVCQERVKLNLHHWIANVTIYVDVFFQNLSCTAAASHRVMQVYIQQKARAMA